MGTHYTWQNMVCITCIFSLYKDIYMYICYIYFYIFYIVDAIITILLLFQFPFPLFIDSVLVGSGYHNRIPQTG